jgi:hypothetical protein
MRQFQSLTLKAAKMRQLHNKVNSLTQKLFHPLTRHGTVPVAAVVQLLAYSKGFCLADLAHFTVPLSLKICASLETQEMAHVAE